MMYYVDLALTKLAHSDISCNAKHCAILSFGGKGNHVIGINSDRSSIFGEHRCSTHAELACLWRFL